MQADNPYAAPAELGVQNGPEETYERSPIASADERILASLVDLGMMLILFLFTKCSFVRINREAEGYADLLALATTLVFASLYWFLAEVTTGKTIGKCFARTSVVTIHGRKPTSKQIAMRMIGRLLSYDAVSTLVVKGHPNCFRDRFSNTVVVADGWNRCKSA